MDDLISRQAAIDTIHKAVRDNFPQGEDGKPMTKTQLMMFSINKSISTAVKALPSAVVRCGECKFWTKQTDSIQGRCALFGMYPTSTWFCGNARRREDG